MEIETTAAPNLRKWNLLVNIPLHQSPSSAQFVHSKAECKSAVLEVKRLGLDYQTSTHPPFKRNDGIQGGDRVECWLAAIGENKASSVRFSWLDCFRHQDRRTCQLKRSGLLVYSKMALLGVHLPEYGSVDRFLDKTHRFL